jgi:hypothetical protein
LTLVELWALKVKTANGKPFNASRDILDAALDIINAAAFAFDDSMGTIKRQLDYLKTSKTPQCVQSAEESVEFARLPDTPDIAAIQTLSDHLGTQFESMKPRFDHRIKMLTSPKLRRSFAQKDEMIRREVVKSLERIESGDETMSSALDHLLQRERSAALKAGRKPEFHSKRIYDEVYHPSYHTLSYLLVC